MMRSVVRWSIRFRFLVVAFAAALMFFGAREVRDMPVDVFPEFAPPRVEIQTRCLGLSAAEVEALVTIPLEEALNGIAGVDILRSKSVPQLSSIEMIFDSNTDLLLARQLVLERLQTVRPDLPSWSSPPAILPPLSATSRVMKIGVSSPDLSLIDLSVLSYYKIRSRLLRVPGVANVAIWGERKDQLQVQIHPELLEAHDISVDQVMKTTSDALDVGLLRFSSGSAVGTGGMLETGTERLSIRHILPIVSPENLSRVHIDGTRDLRLSDVATLTQGHQLLIGDAVVSEGEGLLLIVEKFPWANTLDVTNGVEDALATLQPGLPGVKIDSAIFRPATFIENSIDNLSHALIVSVILVILVLAIFLFEWRTVLISLVAIPLSLMAAALVLNVRGATINVMVLAGLVIAVGVVVDDAIIDVENIWRRLRLHRREGGTRPTASVILDASLEVRSAIVHATLMDVVALTPIFLLEGVSGSFFRPLALSYALAVLASMFVALTVTPAMALILLSKAPLERREPPARRWLQQGYGAILERVIPHPRVAFVTVGAVVLLGLAVTPQLGQSLLPSFKERDFLMHWLTKPGTSHPEMVRITDEARKDLLAVPGVMNFGAHIGQANQADEVVGVDFGENWISIDPNADYEETVASVQRVVDAYPGLKRDLLTYLKERIREVVTGSSEAITIRIYGEDLETLRTKAQEVRQSLAGIDGIIDLHVELQVEIPQVEIEVDLLKAQQYGIKPGDVRRIAATWMASEEVGDIYRAGKTFDVNVWSAPETRMSITDIKQIPLDTPSGDRIQLQDVAAVRIAPVPNAIRRERASRRIDVGANVEGRDLGAVVGDVERALTGV